MSNHGGVTSEDPDPPPYGYTAEEYQELKNQLTETDMFLDLMNRYKRHPSDGVAEIYPRMTPEDQQYLMALIASWDKRPNG